MTGTRARFAGRTAIVTGATSGIGKAITHRLLAEGANVVAAGRGLSKLDTLPQEFPDRLHAVRTDVTSEDDIRNLVTDASARFGRLDLAFNVAGAGHAATLLKMSAAEWDATMAVNLRSVFLCMKYEAASMIAGRGGAIVNVSSVNQFMPMHGAAAYTAAKAGLGMLTQNAALEFARHGIRVNALLPGLTETPMTAFTKNPKIAAAYMERIPFRRRARPEEMAGPALFLASDDASYITGASLVVDGGWSLTGYPDMSPWFDREPREPR